jgi:serine/threonine-protein kinase
MSPELALGRATVDSRADIYALGCVAYWLLTGQLVFEAESALAMSLEHLQTKPAPPSTRTEIEIPEELDRLILDMLAKDAAERPATARELSRRLRSIPVSERWTNEQAEDWWAIHMPAEESRVGDAVRGGA